MRGTTMKISRLVLLLSTLVTVFAAPLVAGDDAVKTGGNAGDTGSTYGPITYDPSGNIYQIGSDGATSQYSYDTLGRLREASTARGQYVHAQSYTYDVYGNRASLTTASVATTYSVNATTNRLGTGAPHYAQYDLAGNLTQWIPPGSTATRTYTYDALNMMMKEAAVVSSGIKKTHFIYTASDERYWVFDTAADGSNTGRYALRDLEGRVLREYREDPCDASCTGNVITIGHDYVYRGGALLADAAPASPHHYTLDHIGTPRIVTNQSGVEVGRHTYHPFGSEITDGTPSDGPLKFTGHERDPDLLGESSGALDYMHARYYAANMGRFLSVDPTWESADLGRPQSWNRYSYVLNDPINMVDPDGKVWWDLVEAVFSGDTPAFEAKYDPSGGTLPKDPAERAKYIELNNKDPHRRASTLSPGPHAGESIPARDSQPKFTPEERAKMNEVGKKSGCHTCGSTDPKTKSGNFVPDHQPPSKINPPGQPQKLYPHCIECSRKQGGQVRKFLIELAEKARKLIPGI